MGFMGCTVTGSWGLGVGTIGSLHLVLSAKFSVFWYKPDLPIFFVSRSRRNFFGIFSIFPRILLYLRVLYRLRKLGDEVSAVRGILLAKITTYKETRCS
jgi:hypothetical protein